MNERQKKLFRRTQTVTLGIIMAAGYLAWLRGDSYFIVGAVLLFIIVEVIAAALNTEKP